MAFTGLQVNLIWIHLWAKTVYGYKYDSIGHKRSQIRKLLPGIVQDTGLNPS